ncbi:MAG: scavenger receptor cysteine-rich domain-containing protein [Pseudomonadota bacterium]
MNTAWSTYKPLFSTFLVVLYLAVSIPSAVGQTRVVVIPLGGDEGNPQARIVRSQDNDYNEIFRFGVLEYTDDTSGDPTSNWGRVCGKDEFGNHLSNVQLNAIAFAACRDLGYEDGVAVRSPHRFTSPGVGPANSVLDAINNGANSDRPIVYSDMSCPANASSMRQCTASTNVGSCTVEDAIGIYCLTGETDKARTTLLTNADSDISGHDNDGTSSRTAGIDLGFVRIDSSDNADPSVLLSGSNVPTPTLESPSEIEQAEVLLEIRIIESGATHTLIIQPPGNTDAQNEYFRISYDTVGSLNDINAANAPRVDPADFIFEFSDNEGRQWRGEFAGLTSMRDDMDRVIVDLTFNYRFAQLILTLL